MTDIDDLLDDEDLDLIGALTEEELAALAAEIDPSVSLNDRCYVRDQMVTDWLLKLDEKL